MFRKIDKKKLMVISYSESSANTYYEQIKTLFSDNIILEKICIDNEKIKNGIEADLVLVQSQDVFRFIRPYMQKKTDIIIATRTISKAGLQKVMQIEEGASVLFLDETKEMAMQMISILYQLGIRNLDIEPGYPGNNDQMNKDYIIVLGTSIYNSYSCKKVINVGNSLLELNTIIDIGTKLNLSDILQRQNIRESYREIVTTNIGLSNVMGLSNRFESELDILLQILDDGIIGIDAEGIIRTYTEVAENIVGYKKNQVMNKHGLEIMPDIPFKLALENLEAVKEKLIKINGYDIVASVHPIIHSGKLYGAVAIVRKFSDIEKNQHKLRQQLIGKGHIAKYNFQDIIGESEAIKNCKNIAKRMAKSDSSVMITGETGTGKEMFAQAIHNSSQRKKYQFVAVNCGALPESLLESELFGYEEGAFTGARKGGKPGLFELAHNGTLFLDEIGEMPINLQMRLLRVIQEREVMRIGGDRLIKVNIRIIAATNRNLKEMVRKGEFREDLYYRLNVLPLKIPPLRDRKEDILFLINEMKNEFKSNFHFTEASKEMLINHNWRGNIRELKNYVEYLANLELDSIDVKDLPFNDEVVLYENILTHDEEKMAEEFLELADEKLDKYIFIMEELKKSYINKTRIGRRTLYKTAREKGIFISEQEARLILINLEKFLMAKVYKGRGGSVITEYGIKVLKYLKA
ncbi:sigma-54 interaction domain-containing protein [Clostridium scatologenes]|uniref:Putative sigma54 specific transcriptional regulator n=1 Tax=Clostridium scatologenes TaxID=1548 RepID=A0A0E3JZZ5_CLOSL|nr:sigma 54-interacting transcriptional regulator [Clostridium scatologenes]AKA69730.1 putative sigma54 specific transcriptional regulator [Clostridium scatologenes]